MSLKNTPLNHVDKLLALFLEEKCDALNTSIHRQSILEKTGCDWRSCLAPIYAVFIARSRGYLHG
ncbi:hypothetical protein THF1C08_130124 [Vibrio jasicida]|uniref:Uncharacterized protein n=1 Tax=Vibrio jasicida TaxID=766224 RepID=A0AAU9QJ03_9VIBR|nr:hypothetical protein THF1C08_130124 [Vibrio jasicida]CAH1573539.1 hypothetical protein THF1A12_120122 [Vibrio jasicida]